MPSDVDGVVVSRPGFRRHSKDFKERVVAEYDALPMQTGERGSFLRYHNLGRHQISVWRAQQAGKTAEKGSGKTGPVAATRGVKRSPDQVEIDRLRRENTRLQTDLARTRLALEITGKAHAYVGDRCQGNASGQPVCSLSRRLRSPSKIFSRATWPLSRASSRCLRSVGLNSIVVTKKVHDSQIDS